VVRGRPEVFLQLVRKHCNTAAHYDVALARRAVIILFGERPPHLTLLTCQPKHWTITKRGWGAAALLTSNPRGVAHMVPDKA